MTHSVNIYALSRIHEEAPFNNILKHEMQLSKRPHVKSHEMSSLRILVDELTRLGVKPAEFDDFFFSYSIPHIGKEFDLLKFSDEFILNIELKSQMVGKEKIAEQLVKNRHYLAHISKVQVLYTVVTSTMQCFRLSPSGNTVEIEFGEIAETVKKCIVNPLSSVDSLFTAAKYLVSPIGTPDRFIAGEYFLTQPQEIIKKKLLSISSGKAHKHGDHGHFVRLAGNPGTGKTLLLYDIAKELSGNGKTLILHSGIQTAGHNAISNRVSGLDVMPIERLDADSRLLYAYDYILVDETHRISKKHFKNICDAVNRNKGLCIFSIDPRQILSLSEQNADINGKINKLSLCGDYILSEKIRSNRILAAFARNMMDLKDRPQTTMNYEDVELAYANTTEEARNLIAYYRSHGYIFINYSRSAGDDGLFNEFEEDYSTHHVIGQEFDKVVMLMDDSFYYDTNHTLQSVPHPNQEYLYTRLFYQGVTRVREKLALVIIDAPELFRRVTGILRNERIG